MRHFVPLTEAEYASTAWPLIGDTLNGVLEGRQVAVSDMHR